MSLCQEPSSLQPLTHCHIEESESLRKALRRCQQHASFFTGLTSYPRNRYITGINEPREGPTFSKDVRVKKGGVGGGGGCGGGGGVWGLGGGGRVGGGGWGGKPAGTITIDREEGRGYLLKFIRAICPSGGGERKGGADHPHVFLGGVCPAGDSNSGESEFAT